MDFRQIRYFIAIAEKGGLSAASQVVHVAPPALSTQIANLEDELGVKLFERHGRGVKLTASGTTFLKHAYIIRDQISAARQEVTQSLPEPSGIVYAGLPMTTSNVLAVPIIEHVRYAYQKIDLRIVDGMSGDVGTWLIEGRLDVAVLYEAHNSVASSAIPLIEDDLLRSGLDGPDLHDLDQIPFSDLRRFPQIASSDQHALRRLLDDTATRQRASLNYVQTIDSIPQLRELVLRGIGYTILPRIAFADTPHAERLKFVPIHNPDLRLRSWLCVTPRREPARAAPCGQSAVQYVILDMVGSGRWLGGTICTTSG